MVWEAHSLLQGGGEAGGLAGGGVGGWWLIQQSKREPLAWPAEVIGVGRGTKEPAGQPGGTMLVRTVEVGVCLPSRQPDVGHGDLGTSLPLSRAGSGKSCLWTDRICRPHATLAHSDGGTGLGSQVPSSLCIPGLPERVGGRALPWEQGPAVPPPGLERSLLPLQPAHFPFPRPSSTRGRTRTPKCAACYSPTRSCAGEKG